MSTPTSTARPMSDEETAALLGEHRSTGRVDLRNRVVEAHGWLAMVCSRRLRRRNEPLDDLVQVANIGILKAAERYDPTFGVLFRTYASATAYGEYSGTRTTRIPMAAAASRSTWLKPAERRASRRVPPRCNSASVSASTRSFTKEQTAGAPCASSAVRLVSLGSKNRSTCPYLALAASRASRS